MHPTRPISRRQALTGLTALAASTVVLACGQAAPTSPAANPAAAAPTSAPSAPPTAAVRPTAAPAQAPAPVVATAPAATPTAAAQGQAITRGGQLNILQINDFVSMDPIFASGPTAVACYDWLTNWRPNDKGVYSVVPGLAESWKVEGNKITFKLRQGIKFHDGSDLDADTVVWNLKRMVQNPKSFAANVMKAVDSKNPAQTIDPLTVQLNMTRPSAAILSTLSDANGNTAIVSKKAADDHGEDWLKLHPVGTGPFTFVSFTSGDKLVVKRNENYWRIGTDGKPMPYVDGVTYRVVIQAATEFDEMRAGGTDLIQNVRALDVPAAKQISHARYIDAVYNGNKRQFFFNSLKPPFKDNLKLRQAVEHAVDSASMAKALSPGFGYPLPYEFVPGEIGYSTSVPAYDFNLDKANQLIKESGVTLPLNVRLTAHNRDVDTQQAQLLQAMLGKIGIKVQLDIVERVAWGEKVRIQNDFQMATRQSGVPLDPTDDLLVTWAEGGNSAYHRAHVPGLIDTLNKADASFDPDQRQSLFEQAQKLMYDSAWFGYMWFEPGNFLVHKRIQGFNGGWGSLREWEWWIGG